MYASVLQEHHRVTYYQNGIWHECKYAELDIKVFSKMFSVCFGYEEIIAPQFHKPPKNTLDFP